MRRRPARRQVSCLVERSGFGVRWRQAAIIVCQIEFQLIHTQAAPPIHYRADTVCCPHGHLA